jgi:NitT/TauT family transport system substrate-binding protein
VVNRPAVFDLVKQGRIAGYAVSIDTAKVLEQQQSAIVLNPGEFIESGGQLYVTSRDGLTKNREAIAKYLRAVHAAIEFMINDEGFDMTLAILRKQHFIEALQDTFIAKESLKEYVSLWTSRGRESVLLTDPERWASGYQELVDVGFVEHGAIAERWFTNELVEML